MGLDETTQSIAERLGRGVVVYDTDLNVIAFSVHDTEVDRGRLTIILNRKATPLAAEMIARSNAKNARAPVLLPAADDVNPRVLTPLRHNGRLFGYLSFSIAEGTGEAVLGEHAELLTRASDQLGAQLAVRELANQDDASSRQSLMDDLLGQVPDSRKKAADSILASGFLAVADHYTVVVVRPRSEHTTSHAALAIESVLRDVMRLSAFQAFGTASNAMGVAIMPGDVDGEQLITVVQREADVIGGVGGSRMELSTVVDSFREARIACEAVLRLHEASRIVANWQELGLDRVLVQLPLDTLRLEDLPDGVRRLLSVQSGIDMAHTLDRYLSCGGEAQEASRLLHIHRSTLYYRLDKIREITGQDLADGLVRRELHTGLRIARLAGYWAP